MIIYIILKGTFDFKFLSSYFSSGCLPNLRKLLLVALMRENIVSFLCWSCLISSVLTYVPSIAEFKATNFTCLCTLPKSWQKKITASRKVSIYVRCLSRSHYAFSLSQDTSPAFQYLLQWVSAAVTEFRMFVS